jgi:predicted DNA-binding protein with PD1-like motif
MKSRDVQGGILIRLERGEQVAASIAGFCESRGIEAATFSAIGAIKNTQLGYYSLETREYFFKTVAEDREVASMTGNVALVEGKPFVHVHALLSACDESLAVIGGHIKEAEVAVTLEVFLTPLGTQISRIMNDEVGLKLLDL